MRTLFVLLLLSVFTAGCVPAYTLVSPGAQVVAKGDMRVTNGIAWNKAPKNSGNIPFEETWTLNGPALDSVEFIAGVSDGKSIAKQKKKDDRQVPTFRANMTPPELVSMIESYYRIKAGASVFKITEVKPTTFLGSAGMQLDYDYIGGDDVERKGRSVLAVVDGKFYLMSLNGTQLHYFPNALPDFERMVASATRR